MAKGSSGKTDKEDKEGDKETKAVNEGPSSTAGSSPASTASKLLQNQGNGNDAGKLKAKSIVQSLGNAGTTVSFVPTALRRKRQSNSNAAHFVGGGPTKKRSGVKGGSGSSGDVTTTPTTPAAIVGRKNATPIEKGGNENEGVIVHPNQGSNNTNSNETATPIVEDENDANSKNEEYTESKVLQKLHSSVHPYEMYDPIEPNDYLTYRQNKENELIRRDLQRQAMKTLELQQQLREHIEEERKKVLESGDVNKIIESRISSKSGLEITSSGGIGRGRGRGRGLNNLPAWLVNKQKEKERQKQNESNDEQVQKSQFDDSVDENIDSGFTVVLTNMVGPGEVDDELQDEVKEECEMKCGKVITVRIDDKRDEVKVFVTFQNKDDAIKAPDIFHGRMFGQRQISALLL